MTDKKTSHYRPKKHSDSELHDVVDELTDVALVPVDDVSDDEILEDTTKALSFSNNINQLGFEYWLGHIMHFRGTNNIIDLIFRIAQFSTINIEEWFEYDGEYFHFRVNAETENGLVDNYFERIVDLINTYKNDTSFLEDLNTTITRTVPIYMASWEEALVSMSVETGYLYFFIDSDRKGAAIIGLTEPDIASLPTGYLYWFSRGSTASGVYLINPSPIEVFVYKGYLSGQEIQLTHTQSNFESSIDTGQTPLQAVGLDYHSSAIQTNASTLENPAYLYLFSPGSNSSGTFLINTLPVEVFVYKGYTSTSVIQVTATQSNLESIVYPL